MKKLVLMSLLIINGIAVADSKTVNLSLNDNLEALDNVDNAKITSFDYYPDVSDLSNKQAVLAEGEEITITKGQPVSQTIPALGHYVVDIQYYDNNDDVVDNSFGEKFEITENNQNIELPADDSGLETIVMGEWGGGSDGDEHEQKEQAAGQ